MEFNLKTKLCVELVLRLGSGIKGWLWSSEVWCHPLSSLHFSPVWLVCPSLCVPPVSCCLPHLVYIRWVSLFYPSSHSVPVSLWALCLTEILVFYYKIELNSTYYKDSKYPSVCVCFLYYLYCKLPWMGKKFWAGSSCVSSSSSSRLQSFYHLPTTFKTCTFPRSTLLSFPQLVQLKWAWNMTVWGNYMACSSSWKANSGCWTSLLLPTSPILHPGTILSQECSA